MKRPIKLSYPYDRINEKKNVLEQVWRVVQIEQSTEYVPGQYLDKAEVDRLCNSTRWSVTSVMRRDTK